MVMALGKTFLRTKQGMSGWFPKEKQHMFLKYILDSQTIFKSTDHYQYFSFSQEQSRGPKYTEYFKLPILCYNVLPQRAIHYILSSSAEALNCQFMTRRKSVPVKLKKPVFVLSRWTKFYGRNNLVKLKFEMM